MQSVKFARIGIRLMQNESPHQLLDSSLFVFTNLFRKKGEAIRFGFSIFDIFRSIVASSVHVIQNSAKKRNKNEHSIFLHHHQGMGKIR